MLMKVPFVFDAFDGAEYSFEREASWCNRNSLWSCSRLLSKPKYLSTWGACLSQRFKMLLLSVLLSAPNMSGVPYALLLDEDFMNCLQDVLQQDQVYCMQWSSAVLG